MKSVFNWLVENLKEVERAIVTIAALLALWPIGLWVSERDDRRLERVAQLIQASVACSVAQQENYFGFDGLKIPKSDAERFRLLTSSTLDLMCWEIKLATSEETIPKDVYRLLISQIQSIADDLGATIRDAAPAFDSSGESNEDAVPLAAPSE